MQEARKKGKKKPSNFSECIPEKSHLHKFHLLTQLPSCLEALSTYSTNCLFFCLGQEKERHAPEDSQQAQRSLPLSSAPELGILSGTHSPVGERDGED